MNINLDELELNDIGSWPLPAKLVTVILISIALLIAGFWLDTRKQIVELDSAKKLEIDLRSQFEQKQHRAANLQAYKDQMKIMKASFGALLKQLPEKTEVPGLVEDISQQGLAAGLEFRSIRLLPEKAIDFYVELPIEIAVIGNYHQLSEFVSNVASLPRIVTLHDFSIQPINNSANGQQLLMNITAKTYRYTSEKEGNK